MNLIEQDGFANEASRRVYRTQLDRDGAVSGLESIWVRRDGSSFGVRVSAHAIRDEHGVIRYFDGTFEDITAQQSIQAALHLTQFCVDEQLHQRALAIFGERLGNKSIGVLWAYQGLGEAALGQADPATATQWLSSGLQLSRELGSAAALDEEPERAARLWGAAEHLRATLGCRSAPAARATYERLLAQARAQLGEGAFAAAWAAGEALSLEQAIAEALGGKEGTREK